MDSVELTNEVYERLADVPSHTVLSMHRIVKEVIAVLVERGFIAYDGTKSVWPDGNDDHPGQWKGNDATARSEP